MKFLAIATLIASVAHIATATPMPAAEADAAPAPFAEPEPEFTWTWHEPATSTLTAKRYKWSLRASSSQNCPTNVGTAAGDGSGCLTGVGGNSIVVSGSCFFTTWSGSNCRGSSRGVTAGCNNVPFASVSVQC